MKHWPHAPPHKTLSAGTYIITAAKFKKYTHNGVFMASKPLEGSGSTLESTFELFAHQLIDPVSKDWMTDAVTLNQCGHTLSQRTADACLERGLPCPIGDPHGMSPYAPSLAIQQIIELFRNASSARQVEQLHAEVDIRLQAQREAEASRVEIERLRQQLREAENALSQVLAAPRDIPGSPPPTSSKEAAAPSQKEGRNASPIVSQGGKAPIIQKGQLEGLETYAFGKAKWEIYFGDIGEEPPLPPNIHGILAGRCPFDPKKTVRETYMLVLVPATVGGSASHLKFTGRVSEKTKRRRSCDSISQSMENSF